MSFSISISPETSGRMRGGNGGGLALPPVKSQQPAQVDVRHAVAVGQQNFFVAGARYGGGPARRGLRCSRRVSPGLASVTPPYAPPAARLHSLKRRVRLFPQTHRDIAGTGAVTQKTVEKPAHACNPDKG